MTTYQPDRLLLLAAAAVKRGYEDAHGQNLLPEDAGREQRIIYHARRWWNTTGRAWAEVLCPDMPLPGVMDTHTAQMELFVEVE